ncbi:Toxin RTX-I translocation ATP-binding protein [Pseudomonas hunanensis]|uniref:Peptidase C39 n=1 Tax=Pseudomonas putida TaxID=303 RepID=A0A2S3X0Y9_PSEPU|nr:MULTISPECIES: type I secretion system permease/ATPase [Pseudomonas]MDF3170859.1 type I secretion system permease/ATPase [Pseudomonas sp. ER28]MDY7075175.1 Toxin RTX-I translocation ATP-binding protein [Pseudomonas hunanensis]POF91751.1 peptidase C39 [Pseudomonas putida]POG07284.1 peptidase C39 [Pseudomonas putida]HDS0930217.1 type I secretion system permease/ATPase [Pseudomonas putida]
MADLSDGNANTIESGLVCLITLARYHGVAVSAEQLQHDHAAAGERFSTCTLLRAFQQLGLKARHRSVDPARLQQTPLPAIAVDTRGEYFIIARVEGEKVLVQDPHSRAPQALTFAELVVRWSGELILVRSDAQLPLGLSRFDFTWFIPALVKYRRLFGEVLVVSLVIQILALLTPLFFQVVMDKVLVHRGLTTLDVIALGLLVVVLFETLLSGLRTYVAAHTASRIDVELGAKLFRHLIDLPTAYFHARRVGDSVARVRELENIRSFLTNNSITLVLDVLFSVVFIAVMFLYSGWLTLVVVGSLPFYFLVSLVVTPLLRALIDQSFQRGAENQAFLVEAVNGIDTLKSMAVEPQVTRRWNDQLAAYVSASFKTQNLSSIANESVGLIGKLVTVATLWLGARLVIEGALTVGELIAFNMLAGRVSQPIIRLAQLWTSFQQTGVSIQRLGDILNTRTEVNQGKGTVLPTLVGQIELDRVCFRYRPDGGEVVRDVSLKIAAGEVIGVVGRSGSGKSTLTRLIQRLYSPERGRVLLDGADLAVADVASLRRQIGVVLQDNVLFRRTVRENIALGNPAAPLEEVIAAATLAGAHEFILELPDGYETLIGEHGASLSGGQRQRIAIARALFGNPRILIFDEATSALDYESERIIQQNMARICAQRTVIIIAHRLSAVRHADRIVVMERGQIIEQGTHDELLVYPQGTYAYLHQLQLGAAV